MKTPTAMSEAASIFGVSHPARLAFAASIQASSR